VNVSPVLIKVDYSANKKVFTIRGLSVEGDREVSFAILESRLLGIAERSSYTNLAQFQKIVPRALSDQTGHVFKGLRRPLCDTNNNLEADENKFAFTSIQDWDYSLKTGVTYDDSFIERIPAPEGQIFVVIVNPNNSAKHSKIDFWIDRWYWIDSSSKPDLPINHSERYDQQIR